MLYGTSIWSNKQEAETINRCDTIEKIGKNFYISNNKYNIRVAANSYAYRVITTDRIVKRNYIL